MSKIPEGFHTVIPSLVINGAAKAISLYEKAFGAKELYRMSFPGTDKIMHSCLLIGNSKVFVYDTNPDMGCATASVSTFYLYLEDVDATFKQAKAAGMAESYPVKDMFWGDRTGSVKDSFGIQWTLATHVREVSPEEMEKGAREFGKHKAA